MIDFSATFFLHLYALYVWYLHSMGDNDISGCRSVMHDLIHSVLTKNQDILNEKMTSNKLLDVPKKLRARYDMMNTFMSNDGSCFSTRTSHLGHGLLRLRGLTTLVFLLSGDLISKDSEVNIFKILSEYLQKEYELPLQSFDEGVFRAPVFRRFRLQNDAVRFNTLIVNTRDVGHIQPFCVPYEDLERMIHQHALKKDPNSL